MTAEPKVKSASGDIQASTVSTTVLGFSADPWPKRMPSAVRESSPVPTEVDDSSIQVTSFATALSLSSRWYR
jgi:hypothetical protein